MPAGGRTQGREYSGGYGTDKGGAHLVGVATPSIDPPSLTAGATGVATFTLTGAKTTDSVLATAPSLDVGNGDYVVAGARVSAADTVEIRFRNHNVGTINPAAAVFGVMLLRAN